MQKKILTLTLVAIFLYIGGFVLMFKILNKKIDTKTNKNTIVYDEDYICTENKTIMASFFDDKVELSLSDDRNMFLTRAISASGIRYANNDESFIFWTKGEEAFIMEKGETTFNDCIIGKLTEYKNEEYGFIFTLPESWKGYSILNETWQGESLDSYGININSESGVKISIRHPDWRENEPMQDIPIMIFTKDQWNNLQQDKFHIGAAPINPSELGRNGNYVFALPARYNFAFPKGYQEVENIISNNPLVDLSWVDIKNAINNCEVKSIMQTHEKLVSAKLKNGNKINAFEPKIDEIMDIAVAAENKCGKIIMATE